MEAGERNPKREHYTMPLSIFEAIRRARAKGNVQESTDKDEVTSAATKEKESAGDFYFPLEIF